MDVPVQPGCQLRQSPIDGVEDRLVFVYTDGRQEEIARGNPRWIAWLAHACTEQHNGLTHYRESMPTHLETP